MVPSGLEVRRNLRGVALGRFFRSRVDRDSDDGGQAAPILELLALEGQDAGTRFTLDGDQILIGRRLDESEQVRGILLRDPTVSARQALVKRDGPLFVLCSLEGTTNPTLLDGDAFLAVDGGGNAHARTRTVTVVDCVPFKVWV